MRRLARGTCVRPLQLGNYPVSIWVHLRYAATLACARRTCQLGDEAVVDLVKGRVSLIEKNYINGTTEQNIKEIVFLSSGG
eukprot:2150534-Pyramimonas_sp.AAC.1